ncbi:hypothetical protein MD484_g3364, partial [Candolleomyces efflorescens]
MAHNESQNGVALTSVEVLANHAAMDTFPVSNVACDGPKCQPETIHAVQDELVDWISHGHRDIEPKSIKWIVGPAGIGKTSILSTVARDSRQKNMLAATFFSSLSPLAPSQSPLFPTLAYQLTQHANLSQLRTHILSAVEQTPSVFDLALEGQLESLVTTPLCRESGQSDRSTWPKVIIIDGLDGTRSETDHSAIEKSDNCAAQLEILKALLTAVADPSFPFKVIFASRPEPAIRAFFDGPAKEFTSILTLDDTQSIEGELAVFLEAKFARLRRKHRIDQSWPHGDVFKTLVASGRRTGQTVYAATVIRYAEESELTPQDALEVALGNGPIAPIHPFSQLDALYTTILQSSNNPGRAAAWLSLIRSMNSGRYCLEKERSFPAFFLTQFLESTPGEAKELLGKLRSLVQIPPGEDKTAPYSFYHKSLFEFLEDGKRSGPVHVTFAHRHIFYAAQYLNVCINKGFPGALPAEQDELLDYFVDLDPFFEEGLLYSGDTHRRFPSPSPQDRQNHTQHMVMDLIVISVGLTVLLARDVYKTVRRKRKERKLRKKLQATPVLNDGQGLQYVADNSGQIIGRPIAPPRTSHNHPDRPITTNSGSGRGSGRGRNGGGYHRLWTRGGERYYYRHGLDYDEEEERIVDHHQSEYGRMPTPPPAYEPGPNPPPPVVAGQSQNAPEYPLPPPFEHAYTAGATGQVAEAQRKAEAVATLARYGQRPPMPPEHVSTQF